jgi:hypothetical protein
MKAHYAYLYYSGENPATHRMNIARIISKLNLFLLLGKIQ